MLPIIILLLLILRYKGMKIMKVPLLFVTIDALGPDLVQKADMPFLKQMISQGASVKNATSCFPTLTTPMMSTILTGMYPQNHGIPANYKLFFEKKEAEGTLRNLKSTTISEILMSQGYKTLSAQHFMLADYDGKKRCSRYIEPGGGDPQVLTQAIIKAFETEKYDAVFTIYQSVDNTGHSHGPLSDTNVKAAEEIDRNMKELYEFLKKEWGEFLTVVSSDHSMSRADKHSNFSIEKILEKYSLKYEFYQPGDKISQNIDCALLNFPMVPIFLMTDKARSSGEEIIKDLRNDKEVEVVYDKKQMKDLGNELYGDISYSLVKGHSTSKLLLIPFAKFGYHGTVHEKPAVINYFGPMVCKRQIESSELVDIVPTVLKYLGVSSEIKFDGTAK